MVETGFGVDFRRRGGRELQPALRVWQRLRHPEQPHRDGDADWYLWLGAGDGRGQEVRLLLSADYADDADYLEFFPPNPRYPRNLRMKLTRLPEPPHLLQLAHGADRGATVFECVVEFHADKVVHVHAGNVLFHVVERA